MAQQYSTAMFTGKQIEVRCSPPAFKLLLRKIKIQEKSKLEKFILLSLATKRKTFLYTKPHYMQKKEHNMYMQV